jgi:Conserved nitrate reductase-associated protein (Nitr_red_assoc)
LSDEVKQSAEPPSSPPGRLIENAKAAGVTLSQPAWDRLDADERYALIKLGGGAEQSHNFVTALRELLG